MTRITTLRVVDPKGSFFMEGRLGRLGYYIPRGLDGWCWNLLVSE
jgi:hypothetical protein